MSALPGWFQWRGGMLTTCGLRVYAVRSAHPAGVREDDLRARPDVRALPYNARPNESDPATIGCLTHLVRAMNGTPGLGFYHDRVTGLWLPGDFLNLPPWLKHIAAASEWSALMAAGDAAWARRGGEK